MSTQTNSDKRKSELDAILIQLSSQRPSDVWRGLEQVRQWLKEDPEDRDVYSLLVTAAQKNRNLREQVLNIFVDMLQIGSKTAEQTILLLPSGIDGILADADDAYYAAEYDRAIQLYEQVLRLNPENSRAKDHLAKAKNNQASGESSSGLPRTAEQYYRRARSFIAAGDILSAKNLLDAAIETAEGKGMKYSDAEETLDRMDDLLLAAEYIEKAKNASKNKRNKDAIEYYEKALRLDPMNTMTQNALNEQQKVLKNSVMARSIGIGIVIIMGSCILLGYLSRRISFIPLQSKMTETSIATNPATVTVINTETPVVTLSPTPLNAVEAIVTSSSTPSPTETAVVLPTEKMLGIGYINRAIVSTWKEPSGGLIEKLTLNYPLTILEKRIEGQFLWYLCRWEKNGISREGWILSEYITFGSAPAPDHDD
jgi:tetratricopeptide (TPR) repeat protein